MIDLVDEFEPTVAAVHDRWIDWLCKAGVPQAALYQPLPLVGVGPVETHSSGLFEPTFAGPPAIWVPCYTRTEDLADLVCFYPQRPKRWWLRLGVADVLGESNFGRLFHLDPTLIHATPLDWLKAGGDGFVVIDWQLDPVDAFLDAGHLQAGPTIRKKLRQRAAQHATAQLEGYFKHG